MRTHKAINNVAIQFAARVIGLLLYFFLTPYVIHLLGQDLYGLNQLLLQTIGYFNLAELGVGISLSVLLYKYLVQNDRDEINKLLSTAQFIYSCLGVVLLLSGIAFSFFIESFFSIQSEYALVAQVAFIIYIFSASLTFFFSVHSVLLITNQQGYKSFAYSLLMPIFSYVGIVVFTYFQFSVIGFALTTLLVTSINLYGVIRIAKKEFPWINVWEKERDWSLLKTTKNVFVDKLLVLAVFQTDFILIGYFLGLSYVSTYALYTTIFVYLREFVFLALANITNGAGELYEKGEFDKVYQVWRDALSFCFFIAIVLCTGIYFMFDPFFTLWMPDMALLSKPILICFILNLFYLLTVHSSTTVIGSRNLYHKRIVGSVVELVVNVVLSVILVQHFGVFGAIAGTTIGHYCMNSWFIPMLFLRSVGKTTVEYVYILFRYLIAATLIFSCTYIFNEYVLMNVIGNIQTYLQLFGSICLLGAFIVLVSLLVLSMTDANFSHFKLRIAGVVLIIKNKIWKA